jgi:hypothetical protein
MLAVGNRRNDAAFSLGKSAQAAVQQQLPERGDAGTRAFIDCVWVLGHPFPFRAA